jgi:hypothetical protein
VRPASSSLARARAGTARAIGPHPFTEANLRGKNYRLDSPTSSWPPPAVDQPLKDPFPARDERVKCLIRER